MFCHKKSENPVQERAGIGNLGSMSPISSVYERCSIISPLLFAFLEKQRPPRYDRSAVTKKLIKSEQPNQALKKKKPRKAKSSSSTLINDKAFEEHVSDTGCAKWRQQDNNPAARRAPSSVYLMESVRCGAVEDAVISPAPTSPAARLRRFSFPQQETPSSLADPRHLQSSLTGKLKLFLTQLRCKKVEE